MASSPSNVKSPSVGCVPPTGTRPIPISPYWREDYQIKVKDQLGAALLAFYKARLAERAGGAERTSRPTSDKRQLVEHDFVGVLVHRVRGFSDKQRALDEVVLSLRAEDARYRESAAILAGVEDPTLDDADTEAFWEIVRAAAERALG